MTATADKRDLVTVRVWQVPIRAIHWLIFLAVLVLSVSGFYIGRPFISTGQDPGYVMGVMGAIHQVAAWVFTAAVLARLVFMFIGNQYARWTQFIPIEEKRRRDGSETLKYYLYLRARPLEYAGHNPLAGATYIIVFIMFLVQIFTGFALRSLAADRVLFDVLGGWILAIAQPQGIRLLHHMIMWLTWGFVVHHVYAAMLMDWEERSGLISSMFNGYKRIPRDRV